MTDATEAYLAALAREVHDLPPALATDIVAGVREELRGLDAADAATRMTELGDPASIAAAARDEAGPTPRPAVTTGDAGWYTVLTVALIGIGGFVLPLIGWLAGIGMLWYSRTWAVRDKIVCTLLPPGLAVISLGITWLVSFGVTGSNAQDGNVLMPSVFDLGHLGVIIAVVLGPIISVFYLVQRTRTLRAGARP